MDFNKITPLISSQTEKIKKILFSEKTFEIVENIAVEEKLTEDQFSRLCDEISYVLIGIKSLDSFDNSIENLGLNNESKNKISEQIRVRIFSSVLEILKNNKNASEGNNEKSEGVSKEPSLQNNLVVINKLFIDKIEEISKKYTLNDLQKNNLVDLCKDRVNKKDGGDGFLEKISAKLNISRLLAEQIVGDLENRVFNYSTKTPRTSDGDSSLKIDEGKLKFVEIPENLPIETAVPEEKHDILKRQEAPASIIPKYTPAPQKPSSEPVQRPVEVPRFKAVPIDESVDEPDITAKNTPPIGSNIIENKLNKVTSTKTDVGESAPVKQYVADPYREPLE